MFKTTFNFFFNQEIDTLHMVPRWTGDPPTNYATVQISG